MRLPIGHSSLRGRHTTKDMMSGFFGIRSGLFMDLIRKNGGEFTGKGYKVLLDILRLAHRSARVAEIHYSTFQDRRHGRSKLKMIGHAPDAKGIEVCAEVIRHGRKDKGEE